jgi:hypothetical protein
MARSCFCKSKVNLHNRFVNSAFVARRHLSDLPTMCLLRLCFDLHFCFNILWYKV